MQEYLKEIVIFVAGCFLGGFIHYLYEKLLIKNRYSYDVRCEAIEQFNIIISQINNNIQNNKQIISNHTLETDTLIKRVSDLVTKCKARKINKAYKQYQAPDGDSISNIIRLTIYNLEGEPFKNMLKKPIKGIDNGNDLAIYHIQKIIDLLK